MGIVSEQFVLRNGVEIPKVGFGTWQTPNDVAPQAVQTALRAGFTHVDTARAYENESGVAEGVRLSGVPRESVFVTTKVPAQFKTYEEATVSIDTSLSELDLGYIDLLLIHAPKPWPQMFDPDAPAYHEENAAVWRALEEAQQRGDVRAIGVSNFHIDDLEYLLAHSTVAPTVNQIRFHVGHTQDDLAAYCHTHDLLVEAYSPIATGKLLRHPAIEAIAARLGRTVAQVCIRYAYQKDTLPLPKAVHDEFILQDADIDFELGVADMEILDAVSEADLQH